MKMQAIHYYIGCLFLWTSLLAGCDHLPDEEMPQTALGKESAFIRLSMSLDGDGLPTRNSSGPAGGEEGNEGNINENDKLGYAYENEINDLTVFLYKSNLADDDYTQNGINHVDRNAPVTVLHFNKEQIYLSYNNGIVSGATTQPREMKQIAFDTTYDLLVAVNMGHQWQEGESGLTVGDLLDRRIQRKDAKDNTGGAWDVTPVWVGEEIKNRYSNFRMASAGRSDVRDCVRFTKENNTADKPASTTPIQVERLAARIEVKHKMKVGYPLENHDKVVIQGIAIVNKWVQGSYFLKRVADRENETTDVVYLGKETDENWVIDPVATADKSSAHYQASTYFPQLISNNDFEKEMKKCEFFDHTVKHIWHLAGYALENVNHVVGDERESYSTGLVFKAKYMPHDQSVVGTGGSFFKYGDHLYASLSKAMDAVHGSDWKRDMPGANSTVLAIRNYALTLQVNGPTGYREYLADKIKGKANAEVVAEDLSWTTFVKSHYGYEEDAMGQIKKDCLQEATMEHRQKLSKSGFTRTYLNGYCYYTWWIKHNNDGNDHTYGPMEFAIVRNNIYRLDVNSISSIGDDIPGQTSLDVRVEVLRWDKLEDESITIRPQ